MELARTAPRIPSRNSRERHHEIRNYIQCSIFTDECLYSVITVLAMVSLRRFRFSTDKLLIGNLQSSSLAGKIIVRLRKTGFCMHSIDYTGATPEMFCTAQDLMLLSPERSRPRLLGGS